MKTTGQIIKMLRNERRISQSQLAKALEVSQSTVAMYEADERMPKKETLEAIADYFNVDMNFLYGKTHIRNSSVELDNHPMPSNVFIPTLKKVPLIGTIECGKPVYASQEYDFVTVDESIPADFCLRAHGESMTGARILNGDLVFCKSCDMVNNGQIAAVIIDDEATLKRFYYYEDKSLVVLRPENPSFEDLIFTGDDINKVKVIGKAVSFQSLIK